jgi:sulfide:quinone oxidoreductase
MFLRNKLSSQHLYHFSNKYFSRHSKFIIIGAGTGGIATAKKLVKEGNFKRNEITIFDPSKIHYYQPGWTKIAGIPKYLENFGEGTYEVEKILDINHNASTSSSGYNFQNVAIKTLKPNESCIIDENGEEWNYEHLIVSCGIQVNQNSIPGKK